VRDRLVEIEQTVVVRGARGDAPETFRAAVERVRFAGVVAVRVLLEDDRAVDLDEQRVQGVPFGIRDPASKFIAGG